MYNDLHKNATLGICFKFGRKTCVCKNKISVMHNDHLRHLFMFPISINSKSNHATINSGLTDNFSGQLILFLLWEMLALNFFLAGPGFFSSRV